MTAYEFCDVVLIAFPQTGTSQKKKRPALVILDIGDADLVLAPITTRQRFSQGDLQLTDWSGAGLIRESWVRLGKVASLPKSDVIRRLGRLTGTDRPAVVDLWRRLYVFPTV